MTTRSTAALTKPQPIVLPAPRKSGGMPLLTALQQRRSVRAYRDAPIASETLSTLLWAAFGINRPASGDRTAPYWRHVMVIDLYLAMADGVWLYEPKAHTLLPCLAADIRRDTGMQDFVAGAPLELLYVAHGERMDVPAEERRLYASVDAAFIGENVYLFCISEGLGSVFRGSFDAGKLAQLLRLGEQQFVAFVQTVGHPA
jgi:nitroreductase